MTRFSAIAALLVLAGTAGAQSVNVDINYTGHSVPGTLYAGAAGQPGTWNSVVATGGAGATVNLLGLHGASAGLTLTAKTSNRY